MNKSELWLRELLSEERGYLDDDWRNEEPKAVDEYLKEKKLRTQPPEEKCEHKHFYNSVVDGKGRQYFQCECGQVTLDKPIREKPSPSPEAKCPRCGKNVSEGAHTCRVKKPAPEARVDWEKLKKKIRNIVESVWDRHDGCELPLDNYKEVPEACCYQRVTDLIIKVVQAAFEKGKNERLLS